MSTASSNVRTQQPDRSKLYGLLHETNGEPVERHVRFLKVGFGVPSGPDIHVILKADPEKPWVIEVGQYEDKKRTGVKSQSFATKAQAVAAYKDLRKSAPDRRFPRKFPYFTFLRLGIDGNYLHDFDAIEQHGSYPTELDVIFLTESPFDAAFQKWTAAALQCEGDGRNARRRVDFTPTEHDKQAAAEARGAGEKWFPILGGCFTGGCVYPQGDKPECKPHGRLYFQLPNSPRIGGSCSYDTTGKRSISQLFSCIQQIKAMTGAGDPDRGYIAGIPLKLVLRPYKTVSPGGQPSVQYGVSLEARAENAVALARMLNRSTKEFRAAAQLEPVHRQISAPDIAEGEIVEDVHGSLFPDEVTEANAMDAEFYGEFDGQDDDGFGDNTLAAAPPEPQMNMPRRRSEGKPQQASFTGDVPKQ